MIRHELALVMPVFNEEQCLEKVAREWHDTLEGLDIDFVIIIINDGSTDKTRCILNQLSGNKTINAVNKCNSGHGPSILEGYHLACQKAEWTFQVDSDDEMGSSSFAELWERRHEYDALFGIRDGRKQQTVRKLITSFSKYVVNFLYGKGISDVNVPYRLMKSSKLAKLIQKIPCNTLAPNLVISGLLSLNNADILNYAIPHEGRKTGVTCNSILSLLKFSIKATLQLLVIAIKVRFSPIER